MNRQANRMPAWLENLVIDWVASQDPMQLRAEIALDRSILDMLTEEFGDQVSSAHKWLDDAERKKLAAMADTDFDWLLRLILYHVGTTGDILWKNPRWFVRNMRMLRDELVRRPS